MATTPRKTSPSGARKGGEPAGRRAPDGPSEEVLERAKDPVASRRSAGAEAERTRSGRRRVAAPAQSPRWLVPFALTLLIIGLLYLIVYYLSVGTLPLPIGDWNLLVGFGLMGIGAIALMFWK